MTGKQNVPEIRFEGFADPWEQRKLGELMDVASVRRVHQEDWTDEGVRFLRARDLVAFAKNESIEDPLFISSEMYKEYSAQSGKVSVGDLLVTGVGTIGVPWLVTSDNPVYFKDGNIIWFKNRHSIDGGFFYHSFTASAIQNYINEAAGIGTVGTYTIETGKKTPIWLPSRQEQREIAAMMTHLDTLITLHQRKCQYRSLYGYLSWEQRKLGEVASEFQSGEFISATEITENGDYPVYGGNGLRGYANRYNHEGFYALIGRQGALCGNVNCADGKAYFTEHAVAVQANQCNDTGFLVYLLSRMNLGQYSGQSAQPGLAVSTLKEVETLLPNKHEQYRIGSLLKDLDSLITLHQREPRFADTG